MEESKLVARGISAAKKHEVIKNILYMMCEKSAYSAESGVVLSIRANMERMSFWALKNMETVLASREL